MVVRLSYRRDMALFFSSCSPVLPFPSFCFFLSDFFCFFCFFFLLLLLLLLLRGSLSLRLLYFLCVFFFFWFQEEIRITGFSNLQN